MFNMSIGGRLGASRFLQFAQPSKTSQCHSMISSPTTPKCLTPKDCRIHKKISSPKYLTPKDRRSYNTINSPKCLTPKDRRIHKKISSPKCLTPKDRRSYDMINSPKCLTPKDRKLHHQLHDSDILQSSQAFRSMHGFEGTTPKNRLSRSYSRQSSRLGHVTSSESYKPDNQIHHGFLKSEIAPIRMAQGGGMVGREECKEMLKTLVDYSKEADIKNTSDSFGKLFDNLHYRMNFTTMDKSFHVGLTSARRIHYGSAKNSSQKLERFKIRTLDTGGTVKEAKTK